MKASLALALLLSSVAQVASFGPATRLRAARAQAASSSSRHGLRHSMSMKVGLYFSTMSGNTERIAGYIGEQTGCTPEAIDEVAEAQFSECDAMFIGAPTWNTGADVERTGTAMDVWMYQTLPNLDLKGKKVALFGCGDQVGYGGNFCDSLGELYDLFTDRGATIIGATSTDGYEHYESKAIRDGHFVGLTCDEQNQFDMSEDRVKEWVTKIKGEGMPL